MLVVCGHKGTAFLAKNTKFWQKSDNGQKYTIF